MDKQPKEDMPEWWPQCPYPKKVWPMTEEQYVKAIPDPHLRTAISGYLMREGWCVFENQFMRAIKDYGKETIIQWLQEFPNEM